MSHTNCAWKLYRIANYGQSYLLAYMHGVSTQWDIANMIVIRIKIVPISSSIQIHNGLRPNDKYLITTENKDNIVLYLSPSYIHIVTVVIIIGTSLSKPRHMHEVNSEICFLARLHAEYIIPFMTKRHLSANQNYIKLEWSIQVLINQYTISAITITTAYELMFYRKLSHAVYIGFKQWTDLSFQAC